MIISLLPPPVLMHFLFALLAGFTLLGDAQDQAGFISIDCGLQPDVTSYTEKVTRLNFVSDWTFVDTGESKMILEKYKGEYQRQYSSLRSFPEGNRNCYKIKDVSAGTKYLIRAGFLYGDYDRRDMPPSFDLHIGSDLWDTVNISDSKNTVDKEIIHIPPQNHMLVCLANTGHGIPFISTLELRPLDNAAYQTQRAVGGTLVLLVHTGSIFYKYNKDFYDRFWYKWQPQNWKTLSTKLPIIDSEGIDAHYNIPSVVMSTAAAPVANGSLIFRWPPSGISTPVDAIAKVKSTYGLKRNWQGDPCLPKEYSWEGLQCSYDGDDKPPRIISLNLDNNQLNGTLPVELMAKWKKSLLRLSVNGNPNLCASVSCKKKHSVVPVVASVVGTSLLLLAVAALVLWWRHLLRNRSHGLAKAKFTVGQYSLELRNGQFSYNYNDVLRITNKFERVMVKADLEQFIMVSILLRVHHRNLTALVGYFTDENNTGLIYEYMANGDLQSHLSADNSSVNILSWKNRLQIAIDAAQGLEYLHHGCKPPIIHRDVKAANILLDEKFQAKLSDFGISKTFPTDDGLTHVSTVVAGTPGYLDPEYYKSNRLNEKSDVYSFGMVLLEIITGKLVISKTNDNTRLNEWVTLILQKGLINSIIDPRLQGNFHVAGAWKAVEIAINCVSLNSTERPTMTQVVGELKECLNATKVANYAEETKSKDSSDQAIPLNDLLTYGIASQPSAR
ncbi:putative LRR receptor-like serine/threonine-protein kinase [Morus notabilis]|uniref:Putative LRR receptor-like serine/threonine-protein kinase n=1 Tax=Morus notabilis TaxID=981085 RepID=W9QPT6_9ROSA|nr:putative LRR receptor-like serine/threonine-protein kinase [Morus notabilis]